ncbi:MAG: hypothetical protein AABY07_05895 [Nanoarchaeota archaeon]
MIIRVRPEKSILRKFEYINIKVDNLEPDDLVELYYSTESGRQSDRVIVDYSPISARSLLNEYKKKKK